MRSRVNGVRGSVDKWQCWQWRKGKQKQASKQASKQSGRGEFDCYWEDEETFEGDKTNNGQGLKNIS